MDLRCLRRSVYFHFDFFKDEFRPMNDFEVRRGAGVAGHDEIGPDGFVSAGPAENGKWEFDNFFYAKRCNTV